MPKSTSSSTGPEADSHLWITILAGGVGSRFWPISTPVRPKQLLPLVDDRPMVVATVERALAVVPPERVRVLAPTQLVDALRSVLPELPESAFLVEPRARGTAPVLAWAATVIKERDPDAVLVSLHADHVIRPRSEFVRVVRAATDLATREDALVSVGVSPDRPETGYGYLRPGRAIETSSGLDEYWSDGFVEKPDRARAERYLQDGYLWNTGIFAWSATRFLQEVQAEAPEIGMHLALLADGEAEAYFDAVPVETVDVAVMERSDRVALVRASFEWDDVGAWHSLERVRTTDREGNVAVGEVYSVASSGNVVFSDQGATVLFGVDDLVVVRTGHLTLVAPKERTAELKDLLDELPDSLPGDS